MLITLILWCAENYMGHQLETQDQSSTATTKTCKYQVFSYMWGIGFKKFKEYFSTIEENMLLCNILAEGHKIHL